MNRQEIIDKWRSLGYKFSIEADTEIMFTVDGIVEYVDYIDSDRSIRFF